MPKDHEFENENYRDSYNREEGKPAGRYPEEENFRGQDRLKRSSAKERPKQSKKPWAKAFSSEENIKNRQYSRTSRNQPAKEATTLSKILLGVFVILLIIPLAIFMIVDAQRDNKDIPGRKAEQVMISRTSSSEESSSQVSSSSSSESSSQSSNTVSSRAITVDESDEASSSSIVEPEPAPQPEATPEVSPEPETPTGGGSYVIQAGDTWYGIARAYGIDVYTLLEMNGATTSTPITPGMSIVVP